MVSSTTTFTPIEARRKKNELEVKLNISLQAKRNRTYPELEVGDDVKISAKKALVKRNALRIGLKHPKQ